MCIRDRGGEAQQLPGIVVGVCDGLAVRLGAAHEPVALVVFVHRRAAVSYTHLRAHETVLDLVCRILLEKKNY